MKPTAIVYTSNTGYTAEYARLLGQGTGLPVYAGPTEGTALGNLAAQMIAAGEFASLADFRAALPGSFDIVTYTASRGE